MSDLRKTAQLFKALADQKRLKLMLLLQEGEKNVSELATLTKDKIGNVSARLQMLYHANLVIKERRGRHIYYHLADHHIIEIIHNSSTHVEECI